MKIEILEVINTQTNKPAPLNEILDCLDENIRLRLCEGAGVCGSKIMFGLDDEGHLVLMDWSGSYVYAPEPFVVSKIEFSFEDGPIMLMNDRMLVWRKKDV